MQTDSITIRLPKRLKDLIVSEAKKNGLTLNAQGITIFLNWASERKEAQ